MLLSLTPSRNPWYRRLICRQGWFALEDGLAPFNIAFGYGLLLIVTPWFAFELSDGGMDICTMTRWSGYKLYWSRNPEYSHERAARGCYEGTPFLKKRERVLATSFNIYEPMP